MTLHGVFHGFSASTCLLADGGPKGLYLRRLPSLCSERHPRSGEATQMFEQQRPSLPKTGTKASRTWSTPSRRPDSSFGLGVQVTWKSWNASLQTLRSAKGVTCRLSGSGPSPAAASSSGSATALVPGPPRTAPRVSGLAGRAWMSWTTSPRLTRSKSAGNCTVPGGARVWRRRRA